MSPLHPLLGLFAPTPTFYSVSTDDSLPRSQGGLWHIHTALGELPGSAIADCDQIPTPTPLRQITSKILQRSSGQAFPGSLCCSPPSICSSEVLHLSPLQTFEHTSLCQDTVDLVFPWIPLSFQSSLRYPKPQLLSVTLVTISSLQSLRLVPFALFPRSLWFCSKTAIVIRWNFPIIKLHTCPLPS